MTGPGDGEERFDSTTSALEDGRWSAVLDPARRGGAVESLVRIGLFALQSYIASSMRCQAQGDVDRAADDLQVAAGGLPRTYRHSRRGHWFATLPALPDPATATAILTWRTARVIRREQTGLARHAEMLQPGRLTPQELLVVAYIEHLRWVGCDYHLTTAPVALLDGVDFTPGPRALARRASALCRLADPAAPDVNGSALRGVRGQATVRAAAWTFILAGHVLPVDRPHASATPERLADAEVRRRARAWREDTDR